MGTSVTPEQLRELTHGAAEAELRAHPAPERCDCPGHDAFLAIAAVTAARSHEDLRPGQTCGPCGYREPMYAPDGPVPGQLGAFPFLDVRDDAAGTLSGYPGSTLRDYDPASGTYMDPGAPVVACATHDPARDADPRSGRCWECGALIAQPDPWAELPATAFANARDVR